MDYYTRLKDARIDRDMSQTEVAKAIGTTQHQIYKYENGLQQMTVDRFKQFCTLYKVSADYILGLEKGLEWPREEKRKHTDNCTKYTFLINGAYFKSHPWQGGFLSLQSASHGALPKNVIETRLGSAAPDLRFRIMLRGSVTHSGRLSPPTSQG